MARWKIEYYSTPSGRTPVQEFIEELLDKPRSKVYNTLELLAEFGLSRVTSYQESYKYSLVGIKSFRRAILKIFLHCDCWSSIFAPSWVCQKEPEDS